MDAAEADKEEDRYGHQRQQDIDATNADVVVRVHGTREQKGDDTQDAEHHAHHQTHPVGRFIRFLPPLHHTADAVLEGEGFLFHVLIGSELHAVKDEDGHTDGHQDQENRHAYAGGKGLRNASHVLGHAGQLDEADGGEDEQRYGHGHAGGELPGQVQEGVGLF